MVTEHFKIGKKEERRKAALFNSFHLEPKELGCARTTLLMRGKDILGQSWVPCSWSREARGDKKAQFVLGLMPYLEVGWGTLGEPHGGEPQIAASQPHAHLFRLFWKITQKYIQFLLIIYVILLFHQGILRKTNPKLGLWSSSRS